MTQPHRSLSFPLARVAGIQIRVHVTFFLLVPLFALAGAQPGGPGELGALVWLVVIFGCVVVHELAHCLVGRPRGLVVHEIELLPIGGVSKLENLPDNPPDELAMAIAGPLASIGIAVVAAALAVLLQVPLLPVDLFGGPLLARVAWFNLLIAAFNLLPAFPLDGGRVFRAFLEEHGLSLEDATKRAARAGRAVALVLIAVGVFWDLWLAIIGVFVYFGASAEESATIVHARLGAHVVGDAMIIDPIVVTPTTSAAELHDINRRSAQRAFPVVGPRGYEGIVDADAVATRHPSARPTDAASLPPALAPGDGLEACLPAVLGAPGRALAVLDQSRLVGLLRIEEVQHLLTQHTEVEHMRAAVGDRLVIKGHHVGEPDRDAEILEVHGDDGGPPWLVRWSEDGHEGLYFPGSDATVEHFPHPRG
jgi:Zn-dependent protease